MIKMSATTHAVNTDLRYIPVSFSETAPGIYQLTSHPNPNVMTPGYWMLFAVDAQGVPSVASVMQVVTTDSPQIFDPGDQVGADGESVNLAIQAADPNGDPLLFSATGLPLGLGIDSGSGVISGTLAARGNYGVTVTVSDGVDDASASFGWTVTLPPGSEQATLTATMVSSSQIDLSWTDNATNEDGFKIERKTGAGSFSQIATVGANVTNYSDMGLAASTAYTYRVWAFNAGGDSGYSNETSATTQLQPDTTPPTVISTSPADGAPVVDVFLRARRAMAIRGRVEDSEGEAVGKALVHAYGIDFPGCSTTAVFPLLA